MSLWFSQMYGIKPYYAVKCNPEPQLLNYLYDNGVGFDCASERELLQVKALARGLFPEKVVYANPCKSKRDLAAAADLGSPVTVVDSEEEVDKLASLGYKGGAMIRIAVDDSKSPMPFSTKFGCSTLRVPAIGLFAAAAGIPIHGISFHVGSGGSGGAAYTEAIQRAYTALSVVRSKCGGSHVEARMIDIGGGFTSDEATFRKNALYVRGARNAIDEEHRVAVGTPTIQWLAEPGRFFAKDAFDLYVQVIGKKQGKKGWSYTLDDSLYGQFSCILFDHATPSWVRVRETGEKSRKRSAGTLFGRTCDSLDVIAHSPDMEELEVGDWLYFPSMGAYTRATASEFNGFPTPAVFESTEYQEDHERFDAEYEFSLPKSVQRMPPLSVKALWDQV